ncbi:MAG TPA: hypothetical protein VIV11_13030 [Kofleriaceae bacterium]
MTSTNILVALAIITGACSKNTATTTAPPVSDPVPMTERSESHGPAGAILAAYERARALLAADELNGVADAAREIEASAKTGAQPSPPHFAAIAEGAEKLATASDLKAARDAFGEVSRHVIALLASDKALARGQHVFECPMVRGYKKWVQPSADLQNPYMGKRMLACGGESTWQ